MDLLCCLVFLALFGEMIGASFHISKNATTWTAASEQCNLAVPDLMNSDNKIIVSITDNIDEEVWVGYYQENVYLEYFGCVKNDNYIPVLSASTNPRQCIAACQAHEIIGMSGNQCFCFDTDDDNGENRTLPFCNKMCSGIACGGSDGSASYVSLYRLMEIEDRKHPRVGNGTGQCMYYESNKGLNWAECNTSYVIICENGTDVGIGQKQNGEPFYGDWTTSTTKCFGSNARPASNFASVLTIQTDFFQLWTGVVRSQTIRKYTYPIVQCGYTKKFGYLKPKGNNYELHFSDSKKDTKKTLCESDAVPIDESSSVVVAVVIIIVSIVVVAAIIIAIVLFARKCGGQLPFHKRKTLIRNQGTINKDVISGPVEIQHNSYDTNPDNYVEIHPTTEEHSGAQVDVVGSDTKSPNYARACFVLGKQDEGPYNTTRPDIQNPDANTFNPYNKLSLDEGSDYDHVRNGNTRGRISSRENLESENTYNTTSLGNSKLKTSTGEQNYAYN